MLIRENTIDHNLLAPTRILHRSEKKKNIEKMRSNFPKPASGCNPRIRGRQIIKVTLISRNFLVKRQMLAGVADTNERTRENSPNTVQRIFYLTEGTQLDVIFLHLDYTFFALVLLKILRNSFLVHRSMIDTTSS